MSIPAGGRVIALSGGVGGAKLAAGLASCLAPEQLTVVVNTGDDFEHFGLPVCPDLDTVLYTLAGLNDPERGWGRRDESWDFMSVLRELGGEDWFQLGDKDLALHVARKNLLDKGASLSEVADRLRRRLGIACSIVPMSDDPVRTVVQTDTGELAFQHYFVRDRCEPKARGFLFRHVETARPSDGFSAALADEQLAGLVICPSNPFVSIDPILAVPGVRETLRALKVPIVAVSPIVDGKAIKGPAAKMFEELGTAPSAANVARHYEGLLDGFIIDKRDCWKAEDFADPLELIVCDTIMTSHEDRVALARTTLALLTKLGAART